MRKWSGVLLLCLFLPGKTLAGLVNFEDPYLLQDAEKPAGWGLAPVITSGGMSRSPIGIGGIFLDHFYRRKLSEPVNLGVNFYYLGETAHALSFELSRRIMSFLSMGGEVGYFADFQLTHPVNPFFACSGMIKKNMRNISLFVGVKAISRADLLGPFIGGEFRILPRGSIIIEINVLRGWTTESLRTFKFRDVRFFNLGVALFMIPPVFGK